MRDTRELAYKMFLGNSTPQKMAAELEIGLRQAKGYLAEFKHSHNLMKASIKENPLTYIRMIENELWTLYEYKHKNEPHNADRMRSLEVIYSNYKLN